ncbi:MAG: YbhB/YbcL family Raf kinase inhibitor-like protein [Planctomycetota bacterium]|nr:YbhB/YbcL family Raf kinase inhibitor-like protein [Planctomycetota bacterium]
MAIHVTSSAFEEGGAIPKKFSCEGAEVSPPLAWSGVPPGVKSLAVICDDPDAPVARGVWDHWVLFGLPSDAVSLEEGIAKDKVLPNGAKQGTNDGKFIGYQGPCPPEGSSHRYFFKVYALDKELDVEPGITKPELEKAMEGHILAQGQLLGKYQRGQEN